MDNQKKIITASWVFFLTLLGFDFLILVLHRVLGQTIGFFNIDKEQNFISLYTGIKFWIGATFAMFNFVIAHKMQTKFLEKTLWLLTALGLFWIGLDDLYYLHERFTFVLNNTLGLGGFYGESFNWLIYFSPFIILAMVVFVKLIILAYQRDKLAAYFLVVGTGLFVAALGAEVFGRQLLLETPIPVATYRFFIVLEEAFELSGASAFIFGVVVYFKNVSKKFLTIASS